MKAAYVLLLGLPLVLAACQGNETPKAPAAASQSNEQAAMAPVVAPQQQIEKKVEEAAAEASNAVEVTKEAVSTTAKKMQETVAKSADANADMVAKLAGDSASMSKPAEPVAEMAKATEPAKNPAVTGGDAAKGESLARKCKACHNFTAKKKVGPGLAGIFGRKAGSMPDMKYSDALAAGGWSWDTEHLAAWVCDAKAAIKTFSGDAGAKTKMGVQHICDPAKQADLIAYLKTL